MQRHGGSGLPGVSQYFGNFFQIQNINALTFLFGSQSQQGNSVVFQYTFPQVLAPVATTHIGTGATGQHTSSDWVFASPLSVGKLPYWPDAVLKRHILPGAQRAGITKRIGWHSFRRTLATLLQSSGASIKTTQELMRHASPGITLGVYAKAVTADKRQAQDSIAALFVGDPSPRADTSDAATATA